jgi:hemolysin activation/secretion protein
MPISQLRYLVWLCTLCTASFVSAQAVAPTGNPLSTLPPVQPPRPLDNPEVALPDTRNLQLSKRMQPQLALSTRIQANRIDISGVNAIPFEQVAAIFQPLSGNAVTIEQLAMGVQQATQLYQKAGYALSFVYLPDQSFDNGTVKIIAVEGHAQQVHVIGDTGKSAHLLAEMAAPILDSKPLNAEVFTKQTLLMARMLNLKVGAEIGLPSSTDGATPLVLNVKREPYLFNINGDFQEDRPKAIANLTLNDPLWGGSQWQFSALLENPKKERFLSATLNQLLNAQGTTMRLGYTDFAGIDNFYSGQLEDLTKQRRLELNVMHPIALSATGSTVIGATFFGLNYEKEYYFPDFEASFTDQEKIRALQAHLVWTKNTPQAQHNASATLTRGLDALGAGSVQTVGLVPSQAKFDFTRLSMEYAFRWRFKNQVGVAFAAGGQYSPDILPTPERISFGGWRFGRGYLGGEAAADQGLGMSAEVNRMFTFKDQRWIKTLEPYLLYEEAQTWFNRENWKGMRLRSSSLGIRIGDQKYYALDFSVSKPHGDKSYQNPKEKLRYNISLTYQLDL